MNPFNRTPDFRVANQGNYQHQSGNPFGQRFMGVPQQMGNPMMGQQLAPTPSQDVWRPEQQQIQASQPAIQNQNPPVQTFTGEVTPAMTIPRERSIIDHLKNSSPEQIISEVENELHSRGLSESQISQMKQNMQSIIDMMGIK